EVEARAQEREDPERVADGHAHALAQAGGLGVPPHELGEELARLDADEPAARREARADQHRGVAQERADLDRPPGPMALDQTADQSALFPADGGEPPPLERGVPPP